MMGGQEMDRRWRGAQKRQTVGPSAVNTNEKEWEAADRAGTNTQEASHLLGWKFYISKLEKKMFLKVFYHAWTGFRKLFTVL